MVNFMGPGGGMAIPPYLQGRKPMITPANGGAQTQPMITPKQSVVPGEIKAPQIGMPTSQMGNQMQMGNMANMAKQAQPGFWDRARTMLNTPKITPAQAPPAAPAQTTSPISPAGQSAYGVMKQDLEDQRRSAMSGAVADASARGVYYGTPLTTSQGDIQTQYLRGLGQLQAGVLGNEQQNENTRLGIAAGLLGQSGQATGGKIDPAVMQMMGTLFAPRPGPTQPAISPYGPNNNPNAPQYDPITGLPTQRKL